MSNFASLPSSFTDNPMLSFTASSSSSSGATSGGGGGGGGNDAFEEDACSICLELFTTQDPATVTSCKHEYHLQCILEWSQRSKECPICWQLIVLKDPASQELLAAVETERNLRSRNTIHVASSNFPHFHEDFDLEQDSYSDDSDFDERIMQQLAAAASRARYFQRRERQRSSGHGPSQLLVFTTPSNVPSNQQTQNSAEGGQALSCGSSGGNSPTVGVPSVVNLQPLSSVVPPVGNVVSSTAVNGDGPFKPRALFRQPPTDSPQGSDMLSFSESIKSKWFAASARYKESISKSTRGIKEKLLARNNSVKELSKGVQREMSAGIAGVARMIERLDLTSKRTAGSCPVSHFAGGTSNLSLRGKGVQENVIVQSLDKKSGEIAHDRPIDASSQFSGTVPGQLEVCHIQRGH